MSKNERSKLQEPAGQRKRKQRRKPDERVRRTCERLGSALLALIQEKPIDDVTLQEVLDRASVGRSTFYLHYRDKDDLLLSQLEKFLETMSTALSARKEASHRVVPVEELLRTSVTRISFIGCSATLAISTSSSILRKAALLAGLSAVSRNRSAYQTFHSVNWLVAPPR